MRDLESIHKRIAGLLERCGVAHAVYRHRPVLSYEDAEMARREAGFEGAESKVVVFIADGRPGVFVTLQGRRLDVAAAKAALGVRKLRMATAVELREHFGAEPGAAYPFGFASDIPILIDPAIYGVGWLLFSAGPPTVTVQARGAALRGLFQGLANRTIELRAEGDGDG